MDSTLQNILVIAAISVIFAAYVIAGIIASDRFCERSRKIETMLTTNEICFAFTVLLWPLVGGAGLIFYAVRDFFKQKRDVIK